MTRKTKICYGVDFTDNHLTLVRSIRQRGAVRSEVIVDDEHIEGMGSAWNRTKDLLQRELAAGKCSIATAMPVRDSFTRWLETPFTSPGKAQRVFPALLDIRLPFPLESCVYFFLDQRRGEDKHIDVLAVAARTDQVHDVLAPHRALGYEPTAVDHEGLALWSQSLRELSLERGALRVVAYIGHDRSAFVVGENGRYISSHGSRVGANHLEADDAQAERQLLSRAKQLLRAHGDPAERAIQWIWTGPGAEREESLNFLESKLSEWGPLDFGRHQEPTTFLPRSISERAILGESADCNFLCGPLESASQSTQRSHRSRRLALGYLAAGIALCIVNLGWTSALQFKKQTSQVRLSSLAAELSGMSRVPRGQEVIVVERALQEKRQTLDPFVHAMEASTSTLLSDVLRIARDSRLTLETVTMKTSTTIIQGSADSWAAPDALEGLLHAAGYEVEIAREDAGADERIHFSIEGSRYEER